MGIIYVNVREIRYYVGCGARLSDFHIARIEENKTVGPPRTPGLWQLKKIVPPSVYGPFAVRLRTRGGGALKHLCNSKAVQLHERSRFFFFRFHIHIYIYTKYIMSPQTKKTETTVRGVRII